MRSKPPRRRRSRKHLEAGRRRPAGPRFHEESARAARARDADEEARDPGLFSVSATPDRWT